MIWQRGSFGAIWHKNKQEVIEARLGNFFLGPLSEKSSIQDESCDRREPGRRLRRLGLQHRRPQGHRPTGMTEKLVLLSLSIGYSFGNGVSSVFFNLVPALKRKRALLGLISLIDQDPPLQRPLLGQGTFQALRVLMGSAYRDNSGLRAPQAPLARRKDKSWAIVLIAAKSTTFVATS